MPNLTKRLIDAARPKGSEYFLWCSATPGFGIRIYPTGRKVFVAQVRVGRLQRRIKVGAYGPCTVEQARENAKAIIRKASEGKDPQREKQALREALSIGALCDIYLEAAHAGLVMTRFRRPKRSTTIAIDEGRVSRHIKPLIGKISARDLTRADVQRMADAIARGKTAGRVDGVKKRGKAVVTGGAGTATRVVELLGGIWSWAEKRGYVEGQSPTRGVETARGEAKDRTLDESELARLGQTLNRLEAAYPMAVHAVELIALTGMRRGEACGLKWSEIDFGGQCLRLQETKTGRSTRPIGNPALARLQKLQRLHDVWAFPNTDGSSFADLKRSIAGVFDGAGLTDARSHDLRRTFGTVAANEGYSDATIGELLGHARRGVTARHYIRPPDSALVSAADRVSARIANALYPSEEEAKVVSFNQTLPS